MKKLLLFVAILILSSFKVSIEPREAYAQDRVMADMYLKVDSKIHQADGMTYRVFISQIKPHGVDIEVVNVTKEKLEVEKLKLEISRLKKQNHN